MQQKRFPSSNNGNRSSPFNNNGVINWNIKISRSNYSNNSRSNSIISSPSSPNNRTSSSVMYRRSYLS